MDIESNADCSYDSLAVMDGASVLKKFCGTTPVTQFFDKSSLALRFTSDGVENRGGFALTYRYKSGTATTQQQTTPSTTPATTTTTTTTTPISTTSSVTDPKCAAVVTKTSDGGSIKFPATGDKYTVSTICLWNVGPAPASMGIELAFTVMDIETNAACSYDYLQVLGSSGEELKKYCGTATPTDFYDRGSLTLRFYSDNVEVRGGFTVTYRFKSASGGTGTTPTTSTPTSSTSSTTTTTTTTTKTPGTTPTTPSGDAKCTPVQTTNSAGGYFKYPSTGVQYPISTTCTWSLGPAPGGMGIEIHFSAMDIEESAGCPFDSLSVVHPNGTALAKYCGKSLRTDFFDATTLTLSFISDNVVPAGGFEFTYQYRSGVVVATTRASDTSPVTQPVATDPCSAEQTMTSDGGSIRFPSQSFFYKPDLYCVWRIRTNGFGNAIQISFPSNISIEFHPLCYYDSLLVRETTGESLKTYCGDGIIPPTMTFPYSELDIVFRSDDVVSLRGFTLNYAAKNTLLSKIIQLASVSNATAPKTTVATTTVAPIATTTTISTITVADEKCSSTYVKLSDSGYIQFPASATAYEFNSDCQWNIGPAPSSMGIQLSFTTMDIELVAGCSYDSLTVTDASGTELKRHCGTTLTIDSFPQTSVILKFKSDNIVNKGGFNVTYHYVPNGN